MNPWPFFTPPFLLYVSFASSLEVGDCVPNLGSTNREDVVMLFEWEEVLPHLLWLVLKLLANWWDKNRPSDKRSK